MIIELPYSLVIEATGDPEFFSFYSPDLGGFTGAGRSLEECLRTAKSDMQEFVDTLREMNLPVPDQNHQPSILIKSAPKTEVA